MVLILILGFLFCFGSDFRMLFNGGAGRGGARGFDDLGALEARRPAETLSAASSSEGLPACGGVAGILSSLAAGLFLKLSRRSPLDTGDERTGSRLFTGLGLWQDGRRRIGGL